MTLSFDNPRDVEPILNEPDNQPDWAEKRAEELCRRFLLNTNVGTAAIAQALREARSVCIPPDIAELTEAARRMAEDSRYDIEPTRGKLLWLADQVDDLLVSLHNSEERERVLKRDAVAAERRGYERGVEDAARIADGRIGGQWIANEIRALAAKEPNE